jgi:hypothetical protein
MLRRLAAESGRQLVLEPDAALVAGRFFGQWPATWAPDAPRYAEWPDLPWMAEVMSHSEVVTPLAIARAPEAFLLQVSFPNLLTLFDLPARGGAYLQMGGVPMGDFDPDYGRMVAVVERAGFRFVPFDEFMAMRHSPPGMVRQYVDALDPKVLIPAHGLRPERLLPKTGRQFFPEIGRPHLLADGDLRP